MYGHVIWTTCIWFIRRFTKCFWGKVTEIERPSSVGKLSSDSGDGDGFIVESDTQNDLDMIWSVKCYLLLLTQNLEEWWFHTMWGVSKECCVIGSWTTYPIVISSWPFSITSLPLLLYRGTNIHEAFQKTKLSQSQCFLNTSGHRMIGVSFHWFFCVGNFFYLLRMRFCTFFDRDLHIVYILQHSSQNFNHCASVSNHIHFHVAFLATWPWQGRNPANPASPCDPFGGDETCRLMACQFSLPRSVFLPPWWVYKSDFIIFNNYMTHLSYMCPSHSDRPPFSKHWWGFLYIKCERS